MKHLALSTASVGTAEGRGLVAAVRKFRTRARIVVFFNQLLTVIAVGAAATVAWNTAWASTAQDRWVAFTVTLAVALVAAAALTYLRTPTLSATAAAMDQRLHLQDRIVAALQVGREQDAVSALIVRDAARCLRRAAPADVFPLDLGRRAVAAALLLTMALLTVTADFQRAVRLRQPGTGAGAGAVPIARPESATAAAASRIEAPASSGGSVTRPAATTTSRPIDPQMADPLASNATRGVTDGTPSPSAEAETPLVAPAPTAPNEPESRLPSARTDAQSPPALPFESGGSGTDRRGPSAAAGQSRAELGAAPGGGGASPDSGRPRGGTSGGVAAGSLGLDITSATPESSRAGNRSVPVAGGTRVEAEAAMFQDDIPPALRQYVRDYFLRLQSTGRPR